MLRSDRHHQIRGPRAELAGQRVEGRHRGARRRTAPSGVHGGDDAGRAVGNQQRHAVGRPHRDRDSRLTFDTSTSASGTRLRQVRDARAEPPRPSARAPASACATSRAPTARASCAHVIWGRQLQLTRRKEMRRDRLERTAAQRRAPRFRRSSGTRREQLEASCRIDDRPWTLSEPASTPPRSPASPQSIERYGDRFVHRIFTDDEIAYCRRKRDFASSFAARFAAKEAAMKALGTGHSRGVFWQGIEVVRRHGPPQLRFHDGAAAPACARSAPPARCSRSRIRANWPSPTSCCSRLSPARRPEQVWLKPTSLHPHVRRNHRSQTPRRLPHASRVPPQHPAHVALTALFSTPRRGVRLASSLDDVALRHARRSTHRDRGGMP